MTAPRAISEAIRLQMEDYRAWRWSECAELEESERWRQSITRLDSIQRQCTSDAERAYVMRVAADSPVGNTHDKAEMVLAHVEANGGKIKATTRLLFDDESFEAVVDRAYHLRRLRKKAAGKICKLTKNSSARGLPSKPPPPLT